VETLANRTPTSRASRACDHPSTPPCTGRSPSRVRRARNAAAAGFTLIELMVVVVLISILAVIAAPALRVARDDRMAFDYARQIQQMAQRARARAAARGAAQLVLAGPSGTGPSGSRGRVTMWEALDNTTAASGGPNPVSSCRGTNQWAVAGAYAAGTPAASNATHYIAGLDLASTGVNVDADITGTFYMATDTSLAIPTAAVPAFAICYSPTGSAFAAGGPDTATAITNMQVQPPFTGVADVQINRHGAANVNVGLTRHILIPGSGPARILSR
jgi:prepilin-type N-terminal cleavage/methylation domain-containing protein